MTTDFALFDADNHYYEPRDAFTRHIEPRFRDKAIRTVTDGDREVLLVGSKPFTFLEELNFDTTVKPGSLAQMLRTMKSGRITESAEWQPVQPEYVEAGARLALMDRQGIESCFLFPTLGVCVEHFMEHDADQMYANLHAFNMWLDEEWGFARAGRIYAPPIINLLDVERAAHEVEWVIERGARIVAMRPGPAYGRSPADPHFDPVWARLNEANVAVAFHISESGYNEKFSVAFGEQANPSSHVQSAFQWTNFYGDRPIMDTLSALVLHNLFGRYPNVRVLSVENGSLWVNYLVRAMDKMVGMGRHGPWIGGRLPARPGEMFRRHVLVSPYHEEPIPELVDFLGVGSVVFGSDYPHSEGLAEPSEFVHALDGFDATTVRRIMRDNARELVDA